MVSVPSQVTSAHAHGGDTKAGRRVLEFSATTALSRRGEEDPDMRKAHRCALLRSGVCVWGGLSGGCSACPIPGVWEGVGEALGMNGALPLGKAEPSWLIQLPNAVPI